MANVNDTNNTTGKLERQWQLLREANIDDRDRSAIRDFVRIQRESIENRKPNTLKTDLSNLRNAADRSDGPLVEMDRVEYRDLIGTLTAPKEAGGYGLNSNGSGMYGYKRALRLFLEWLNNEPDYGAYEFWEDIDLPSQGIERVDEDEVLTEEEVEELKNAALNARDKALIEFLADTAARISLASQLRVGDVYDIETDKPYYKPNPDGMGHKDAPQKRYPILYSRAELRSYLNRHHEDTRPKAPLWHVLRGYDPGHPEEGAMSGDRIRDMLRECKRRAGIEKPVNPHNFRHTALTRLSKSGYTPQEIQHIAGWADDRMLEAYDHTTDIERNEQMGVRAGFIDETETNSGPAAPKPCGNCREQLKPQARFCPNCGAPTTERAQREAENQDDRLFESAKEAHGEAAEAVLELRRLTEEYPALRTLMMSD